MNKILPIILVVLFSSNAFSYDEERTKQNLMEDYAQCVSFWRISMLGVKDNNNSKSEKIYTKNYTMSLLLAEALRKDVGIKEETLMALIRKSDEIMGTEMGRNYVNYPILREKYLKLCHTLIHNPESRLEYWREK